MSTKTALVVAILGAGAVVFASPVKGQQPTIYQPPAGSPISPYLNLFRRDVGFLNNYYNYIVPQRQLEYNFRRQTASVNVLQNELQQVQGELQQVGTVDSGSRPTGLTGGFMISSNYYMVPSHYYNTQVRTQLSSSLEQLRTRRPSTATRATPRFTSKFSGR